MAKFMVGQKVKTVGLADYDAHRGIVEEVNEAAEFPYTVYVPMVGWFRLAESDLERVPEAVADDDH